MEEINKQHVQLPHRKDNDTITPREQLIYVAIKRYMNKDTMQAYPSLTEISKQTGASIPTIRDAIQILKDLKYIKVTKNGRKNCYEFNKDKEFEPFSYEFLDNTELSFLEKTYIVSSQEYMQGKETGIGTISYSNRQLSELINMPISTISKCNHSLQAKEFLTVVSSNKRDLKTGTQIEIKEFKLNKFGQAIVALLLSHEERINENAEDIKSLKATMAQQAKTIELLQREIHTLKSEKTTVELT